MANVTQHLPPSLLFAQGFAAGIASDLGIRPHGGGMGEIFKAVAAESEPLGFEDRYLYGRMKSARHGSSLSRHLRANVWNRNRANTQPTCATAQGWKLPAENVGNLGEIRLLVQNCRYIDADRKS